VYYSVAVTTKQVIFSNFLFEEYLLAEVILPNNVTLMYIYRSSSANKVEIFCELIQKVCDEKPSRLSS